MSDASGFLPGLPCDLQVLILSFLPQAADIARSAIACSACRRVANRAAAQAAVKQGWAATTMLQLKHIEDDFLRAAASAAALKHTSWEQRRLPACRRALTEEMAADLTVMCFDDTLVAEVRVRGTRYRALFLLLTRTAFLAVAGAGGLPS